MSSFENARWLRRLWSLASPGDPVTNYVQNVSLVNDGRYRSSRERAPYAASAGLEAAPAAGTHNFVEIGGLDLLAPTLNLIHRGAFEASMANALTGTVSILVADGSTLTTATRVARTPMFLDNDRDVTPRLFVGTITTANIPATAEKLPRDNGIGQTGATPTFTTGSTKLEPTELGFARSWIGPRNCIFFGGDAEALWWSLIWQAIRA